MFNDPAMLPPPSPPLPGYAANSLPVLPPDTFVVQHCPHIGRSTHNAIDYAGTFEGYEFESFAKISLPHVVFRSARMEDITVDLKREGLSSLCFELVSFKRLETAPDIINRYSRHT